MKKSLILSICLMFDLLAAAQNVGVGTTTPQSKLEVKDTIKTTVRISSKNYSDSSQLIFSNRNSFDEGTDMRISSNAETGLRIGSRSDLTFNNVDSIMQVTPQGRVGINNSSPQEVLDVRGNMNITGGIRADGSAGQEGQVLGSDAGGNLQWMKLNRFKYFIKYTDPTSTFTIPTGVKEILVEQYGSGGGGAKGGGGGAGNFTSFIFNVEGLTSITVNTSTGGIPASSEGGSANNGATSTIVVDGVSYPTPGGSGATSQSVGSGFSSSPVALSARLLARLEIIGELGKNSTFDFQQNGTTSFIQMWRGGDGGTAYNNAGDSGKGGNWYTDTITPTSVTRSVIGSFGCGGGGGFSGAGSWGSSGGRGFTIIYW